MGNLSSLETGVLMYRTGRGSAKEFESGKSWLGGLPMLGKHAWPRGSDGRPLFHLVTIDCSEIGQVVDPDGSISKEMGGALFPDHGQLAFFLEASQGNIHSGRVVFLGQPGSTEPPSDFDNKAISYDLADENSSLFPRWPVSFSVLPEIQVSGFDNYRDFERAQDQAQFDAVQGIAGPPTRLHLMDFYDHLPRRGGAWLWDSVYRLASAFEATPEGYAAREARLQKYISDCRDRKSDLSEDTTKRVRLKEKRISELEALAENLPADPSELARYGYRAVRQTDAPGARGIEKLKSLLLRVVTVREERSRQKSFVEHSILRMRADIKEISDRNEGNIRSQESRIKKLESRLATLPEDWERFQDFARSVEGRLAGRGRFELLSDEEHSWFNDVVSQLKSENSYRKRAEGPHYSVFSLGRSRYCYSPDKVCEDTFRAMVAGPPDVFELLPDAVRRIVIEDNRLASYHSWHQLFGSYSPIQDEGHTDKLLLLQLASDNAVGFMFGDAGKLAFWIDKEDLLTRRFDRVEVTGAGH